MVGISIVPAVVMMTYIEAAGLAYFSKRRGWRVPFAHARQVACYAAVGWIPAVVLFDAFLRFQLGPAVNIASNPRGSGTVATLIFEFSSLITRYEIVDEAIAAGIAMLGFELLVWLGVNQVRYANGLRQMPEAAA